MTCLDPLLLPFECHAVLRDNLGKYDYYCYLEDDLILHDPWLFDKLRWFNQQFGNECLLQPNRYEVSQRGPVRKAYIDGDLAPRVTAPFQNVHDRPVLTAEAFGRRVEFVRPLNPHSGCFFLNAEQMEHWAKQPYFLDRDTSFIGPLESGATLGIMKTFRVYKPGLVNADFLEIQHYGTAFISLIGNVVKLEEDSLSLSPLGERGRGEGVLGADRNGDREPAAGSPAVEPQATAREKEPPHPQPLSPEGERGEETEPLTPGTSSGSEERGDGRMHLLFIHQNYPAQFGHIAARLAAKGYRCTFVSKKPPGMFNGVERVQYFVRGGATRRTHYCSRTFENMTWHADGVYRALRARPDIRPDLIVAHAGLGPALFLKELYDCPVVNYFEYFYGLGDGGEDGDLGFRPDFPSTEWNRLRASARNAMLLLDLENCAAGYSPTHWQRGRFPERYRDKIQVIFDGIDTEVWRPEEPPHPLPLSPKGERGDKVVTYVSRGFESMRGFDIFMKTAKRLCDRRRDVIFLVVGQDRCCYSGDERVAGERSFKEWVLSRDDYDLSRIRFVGNLPPRELARLLARSDLHIYLTVPFVLSWSLLNALACGATVLASDTPPVREVIEHERNGLLADFFDVDGLVETANRVLDDRAEFKPLGRSGVELVRQRYSLDVCLPRLERLLLAASPSPRSTRRNTKGEAKARAEKQETRHRKELAVSSI